MVSNRRKIGNEGELIAKGYLVDHGFEILYTNWQCKHGELDVVARQTNKLHFVEIRWRRSEAFGMSWQSLTVKKIRSWQKAAHAFLFHHRELIDLIPFYSLLAIDNHNGMPQIEFLPDAVDQSYLAGW